MKGDKLFHVYLINLKSLWDELHQYHPLTIDLELIKKREEEDKILKLFAGLGQAFENIIGTILMMQPTPSFNSICAIIQRKMRKKVMMVENQDKEYVKETSNSGSSSTS